MSDADAPPVKVRRLYHADAPPLAPKVEDDSWRRPAEAAAEADDESTGVWTDQETLELLKALEQHEDNWEEVSKLVPGKTTAQCVLKFMRM